LLVKQGYRLIEHNFCNPRLSCKYLPSLCLPSLSWPSLYLPFLSLPSLSLPSLFFSYLSLPVFTLLVFTLSIYTLSIFTLSIFTLPVFTLSIFFLSIFTCLYPPCLYPLYIYPLYLYRFYLYSFCLFSFPDVSADSAKIKFDDDGPHVLAAVLKTFFRELPEPVMTFKLYHEFLRAAGEWNWISYRVVGPSRFIGVDLLRLICFDLFVVVDLLLLVVLDVNKPKVVNQYASYIFNTLLVGRLCSNPTPYSPIPQPHIAYSYPHLYLRNRCMHHNFILHMLFFRFSCSFWLTLHLFLVII